MAVPEGRACLLLRSAGHEFPVVGIAAHHACYDTEIIAVEHGAHGGKETHEELIHETARVSRVVPPYRNNATSRIATRERGRRRRASTKANWERGA